MLVPMLRKTQRDHQLTIAAGNMVFRGFGTHADMNADFVSAELLVLKEQKMT